jgi:hypothetical protein
VAAGGELAVNQLTVDLNFKAPAVGRDQRQGLDLRLEILQQFGDETRRPRSVVSDGAVRNLDLQHIRLTS